MCEFKSDQKMGGVSKYKYAKILLFKGKLFIV